ncbi:nuclear transport factor 2 family protein [Pseudomonas sp. 21TX0197]|uniref:nuclear transport factor 2 family protein n=1 Tax=Pseudomonas sp. 21TX0197 TaxID=2972639 RepID=UPI00232C94ED|nr:nuclear transport factor 2 family protein [Pseudomonas sp. 21TX0197]MDB6442657.1 nuclear transport factor 2 family protein [Pseudomonas sp. 21TX0197]
MTTARQSIQRYIDAKDGNRPHLLAQAFTPDATLDMDMRTDTLSFPAHTEGRDGIGDVLVRRFGQTFENVYTFCLESAPPANVATFQCKWLVAMSDKHSGEVRVGCGEYDWRFEAESGLVQRLAITIEHMKTLPASELAAVMAWVSTLDYPWCSPAAAVRHAPDSGELDEVIRYVTARRIQPRADAFG